VRVHQEGSPATAKPAGALVGIYSSTENNRGPQTRTSSASALQSPSASYLGASYWACARHTQVLSVFTQSSPRSHHPAGE
jgi:hypothetical protein